MCLIVAYDFNELCIKYYNSLLLIPIVNSPELDNVNPKFKRIFSILVLHQSRPKRLKKNRE
jgi:hypothetical protein